MTSLRSRYGVWVSGGEASNGSLLRTTEVMERPGTKFVAGRGPKLPKALSRHCLLKIQEDFDDWQKMRNESDAWNLRK